jgi:L-ascorbate oxidase
MQRSFKNRAAMALAGVVLLALEPAYGAPGDLVDPPPIPTTLPKPPTRPAIRDLLIVARETATPITLGPTHPRMWVYEVCPAVPDSKPPVCAPRSTTHSDYGGVRLQANPGDTLRIHLVNRLPAFPKPPIVDPNNPPAPRHAYDPEPHMQAMALRDNPTNLHTHGLLVSPWNPIFNFIPYGDFILVNNYNTANTVDPIPTNHPGMEVTHDVTEYAIRIPPSHPPGLFWFHPHVHGLALNQVSAGLAGIITIGQLGDYVCSTPTCSGAGAKPFAGEVHYLTLKDTQILVQGPGGNDTLQTQEDPAFCGQPPPAAPKRGYCDGTGQNGKWFFTVDGQVYPKVKVKSQEGQIWRITNASGSVTYNLGLVNDSVPHGYNMYVQVVSIDGVAPSVSAQPGQVPPNWNQVFGDKFQPVPCPGATHPAGLAVCTTGIRMMPSSRVELWVTYRDQSGAIVKPPANAHAVLRNFSSPDTGPGGDTWPSVDLLDVDFPSTPVVFAFAGVGVRGEALQALSPQGIMAAPGMVNLPGVSAPVPAAAVAALVGGQMAPTDPRMRTLVANPQSQAEMSRVKPSDLSALQPFFGVSPIPCPRLPAGHMRQITFDNVASPPPHSGQTFGLGYDEIDPASPGTPINHQDVQAFDPAKISVCVPLDNGKEVTEIWQLVNNADEDHNFHIHQTRFQVLASGQSGPAAGTILQDNVPVPHNGSVRVSVTFHPNALGDFVYHCHILEHEDGGMMARIRVVYKPTP